MQQVPRGLPRGRGTAMPERSRISTFWGPETQFLRAFSSAPIHQLPKPPKQISSCSLGNSLMRAEAPLPHPVGGHFPFPREKGSEKGSAQSVAGVAKKPDFLQMSGYKSGLSGRARAPPPRSKEVPHGALDRRCRCPQRVCGDPVAPPGVPSPGASPEKSERKKVAREFLCAVSTQSHPKRWFSSLAWALKNSVGGKKREVPRAQ